MARSALASALSKLFKYMGTRNVRVQARGLKKGMGITRQGQVKNLGGGKRILKKTGGGTTFLKSHAKVGMSRGQKAGSGALAVSAVGAGYMYKPSGPPTAGQKQFAPVNWKKDVAKWSKSGYHKFTPGSHSAKQFKQSYNIAKKTGASEFTWGLTGKRYKVN